MADENGDQVKIERLLNSIAGSAEESGGSAVALYRGVYSIACGGKTAKPYILLLTRADLLRWHAVVVEARYTADRDGKEITWAEAFKAVQWPASRAE